MAKGQPEEEIEKNGQWSERAKQREKKRKSDRATGRGNETTTNERIRQQRLQLDSNALRCKRLHLRCLWRRWCLALDDKELGRSAHDAAQTHCCLLDTRCLDTQ